jgi:GMP synthase-like glutamine amidotransferase
LTRRVLFIEHDHLNPPGLLASCFASRGYEVVRLRADVGIALPAPELFEVIVPLGADWSVSDPGIQSWLQPEIATLRAAWEAGIPLLGACFGGQLLAVALGGTTGPAARPEIGWHLVQTNDPDLIEPGPWLEWHADRWYTPPGARTLARTETAPQAFMLDGAWGLQFHPEADESMVRLWRGSADQIEQTRRHQAAAAGRAGRLVDRFLASCRPVRAYATYGG